MVFMQDSERAAQLALDLNLDVGLHLNFDDPFTGPALPVAVNERQKRTGAFLRKGKYAQILYNPMLAKSFEHSYRDQYEEFVRLYRRSPTHINGHHHMHLCSNVLLGHIIPRGSRVRRTFTFMKGERNVANLLYRRIIDALVTERFITTDMFFASIPTQPISALRKTAELAKSRTVELMTHVSTQAELNYVMQSSFKEVVNGVTLGTYSDLPPRSALSTAL